MTVTRTAVTAKKAANVTPGRTFRTVNHGAITRETP